MDIATHITINDDGPDRRYGLFSYIFQSDGTCVLVISKYGGTPATSSCSKIIVEVEALHGTFLGNALIS